METFNISWEVAGIVIAGIGILNVFLVIWLLVRQGRGPTAQSFEQLARLIDEKGEQLKDDVNKVVQDNARLDREELGRSLLRLQQLVSTYQSETARSQAASFETLVAQLSAGHKQLSETLTEQFNLTVEMNTRRMQEVRSTLDEQLLQMRNSTDNATLQQRQQQENMLQQLGDLQLKISDVLTRQLTELNEGNARRMAEVRLALDTQLQETRQVVTQHLTQLQSSNEARLEEMRRTVDEKLHDTLEKRVSESFKQVAERLEQVHRGLGEMQQLAQGVGDLKHLLTNVKTRGVFGEVQLEQLLEQVLTPQQYCAQAIVKPGQRETVDFAIALPGKNDGQQPCWLPIDAKFPTEDYERLLSAQQQADVVAVEAAGKALEQRIKLEAKSIAGKYIAPPHTTDFAIMFLPTEGLYAEVLRRPGLIELLQRQHHIVVAGPTTLLALLNSLQMGFRTLALEKRSAEVWRVLGAVKTEFTKFGDVLTKMRNQLQTVSNTIDVAQTRTRVMNRALKQVEVLPEDQVKALLPADDAQEMPEDGSKDGDGLKDKGVDHL